MKKIFLFDFDGVIVDSIGLYEETTGICLERIGSPIVGSHDDFLDLFDENFYEAIRRKGVDVEAFNKAAEIVAQTVDYNRIVPYYDLIPVLEELKKEHRLFIVSSNSSFAIQLILSSYQYNGYFEAILSADFMLSKVEKINYVIEKWQLQRERLYFVGDTTGDIKEAKAAGIRTIAVTWGWHSRERLEKITPDYLVDSPAELLEI